MNITRPIDELVADIQAGKLTAAALVQECLDAIKAKESFHAVLEVSSKALDQARVLDQGPKKGRLAGIPFIAKDNFLTNNTHTTAASNILKPFMAPYQSTAIERLEAEGAILVAKANLDAFGHGGSTENSDFGPTKNPWDETKVPGGSSGGSAAAVALGLCSFALGTDTGGSNRQPASLCGVVGFKPTYGLISRYGVISMASSTDTIGALTRSIADLGLVIDVLAGRDRLDGTTIERNHRSYAQINTLDPKQLRVGVVKEWFGEGLNEGVKTKIQSEIDNLSSAGAKVEEISLPAVEMALACYYILVPAEISSNLSRYDGVKFGHSAKEAKTLSETYALSRDQGFGAEAKRRIIIGTYVLSSGYYDAYYKKAQRVRTLLIEQFNHAFKKFDVLIGPTTPGTAFALGEKTHDPLAMYLEDVMTVAPSLVGAPAVSVPLGISDGMPVGLQLIAPQKGEHTLLATAAMIEAKVEKIEVPA